MRGPGCVAVVALLGGCAGGSSGDGSIVKKQLPAVAGLKLTAANDALRVDAEWQSAGPGFSYAVVRTDGGLRQLATVRGTSYPIAGLKPAETICIAIAAVAEGTTGPMSAPACATALDVPGPPASVQAQGIASGLLISWTAAIGGPPITEWDVVVSGKEWKLPAGINSMSATPLTEGARYEISVHAGNAAGRSAPTTISAVAGPGHPLAWVRGDRMPILLPETAVVAHGRLWVVGYESNANTLTPATALGALDA